MNYAEAEIIRLQGELMAYQVEAQGMVAENALRMQKGESLAFNGEAFNNVAVCMRDTCNSIHTVAGLL